MKQIFNQTMIDRMLRKTDELTGCGDVIRSFDPKLYSCRNGEYIYRPDDPVDKLYFILSGGFTVCRNNEDGLNMLYLIFGTGQMIGLMEYVLNVSSRANVICVEDAYLLEIDPKGSDQNAAFLGFICSCLAKQMNTVAHLSAEKKLNSSKARLAHNILLFEKDGLLSMNYALLSDIVGISYRQLMRYLKDFEEKGLIHRVSKGKYLVTDRVRISEMI